MIGCYWHRMGHGVCKRCDWEGNTPSALIHHMRDQHSIDLYDLISEREARWDQALKEGQSSCQ